MTSEDWPVGPVKRALCMRKLVMQANKSTL